MKIVIIGAGAVGFQLARIITRREHDLILVELDQERLAALGISLAEVERAVGVGNINLPGGALRGRDSQFLIRTINEFQDTEEIADLIVAWQGEAGDRPTGARRR